MKKRFGLEDARAPRDLFLFSLQQLAKSSWLADTNKHTRPQHRLSREQAAYNKRFRTA